MNASSHQIKFGVAVLRPFQMDDVAWMTELRNRPYVRRWFFDQNVISAEAATMWHQKRLNNQLDTVMIIQIATSSERLGMVGWNCIDEKKLVFCPGRIAIDLTAIRYLVTRPDRNPGLHLLAKHACEAVSAHLFGSLNASKLRTEFKNGNSQAAALNRAMGMRVVAKDSVKTVCEVTMRDWELRSRQL